jgi:carboxyl-terminal processing protease
MIGLFFVCAAFAAGFLARGNAELLTYLGFDTPANSVDVNPGMTVSGNTNDSLSARIAEVQGILEQQSLDTYDLDAATAMMLNDLSATTGDPYVSYLDESHYETYLSSASSDYEGIGVLFSENNGQAYAVDVFSGSEAESKDVRSGDYIVAIDGDRGSGGWTQAEVVKTLAQAKGKSVIITWRRPTSFDAEGGDEYTVDLMVSEFQEPNVTVELVDDAVGYIKLAQITSDSTELVQAAVEKLEERGATSYVLDLRNNPGGYLTQAVDIGSLFVKSGTFVEIQAKDSSSTREVGTSVVATEDPLVVIINGKTAAAAEVLAGGLQDNGRAVIVGESSMGKGTVQSVARLSFGGGLRHTSAYYKTPSGREIDGNGINPDMQVSEGSSSEEDAQKKYAIDAAKSLMASS